MLLYAQYAGGTGPGAAAYKALEYAIQTNNVSGGQSALDELQRDSVPATPPTSATTNSSSPVDSGGDYNGSPGHSLNLIA
jgi:hypothetical protein